ncbi:MAG: cobalamin B12-binding domain-containing protein [Pseudomonadota bacterium]
MDTDQRVPAAASTISEVERETGLAKETLRVWERRYGFPQPTRDRHGERLYPPEQVHKLLLVKRLLDLGHRPGKIMGSSAEQLHSLGARLGAPSDPTDPAAPDPVLAGLLALCHQQHGDALRQGLSQALLEIGLRRFVTELAAPLLGAIGLAWAQGQMAIHTEHLCSETLHMVLRNAIFSLPWPDDVALAAPRVLFTTLPQERHGLGLLMAEAMCAAEGAHCISLGVQTPLLEIVAAARDQRADVVALSLSSANNPRQAADALAQLRAGLPAATALWAGGSSPALRKRVDGVQVLELADLAGAIADWRGRHGAARHDATRQGPECRPALVK